MSLKYKIIIFLFSVGAAFASGRFLTPVKTVIQTVEVEKKTTDQEKHQKKTIIEIVKPDGTKETTTTLTNDTSTVTTDNKQSSNTETKEVQSGHRLTLTALGGINLAAGLTALTPIYGGSISTALVGPVNIGLFGMSNGVVGVSLGLTF